MKLKLLLLFLLCVLGCAPISRMKAGIVVQKIHQKPYTSYTICKNGWRINPIAVKITHREEAYYLIIQDFEGRQDYVKTTLKNYQENEEGKLWKQ